MRVHELQARLTWNSDFDPEHVAGDGFYVDAKFGLFCELHQKWNFLKFLPLVL